MTLIVERPSQTRLFPDVQSSFVQRKIALLNKLKSPTGKTVYKRYLGSPLRYAGGKSLGVGFIAELLPDKVERIISPFFGGGSIEIACASELDIPVIGYDIFDILTNYWEVQLNEPFALYEQLLKFEPTRETFANVKARLKEHWTTDNKLERIELAAHYYFNSNTSYGPHFLGWPSDVYLEPNRYKTMIEKLRDFQAPGLMVGCESFEKIVPQYNGDLLYCDPPYYLDGDSKTFIGMYPHRNFPIHHNNFKHELLRDLLLSHKGGFILSYNDCSTIREWYKGFNMATPKWQYTFSQGDTRIGENRLRDNNGSYIKKSHELLIWNIPS